MNNSTISETYLIRHLKIGLFIALEPPSLICNLVLIYYLVTDRTLRRSLHHHSVLALLVVSLLTNIFDVPRLTQVLHTGSVMPQTIINCLIWQWYDSILYGLTNVLLFWASVERYIYIFHGDLFNTVRRRLLFHYLPLLAIIVYLTVFYAITIFFIPCNEMDFTLVVCGVPCFTSQLIISLYDNFAHNWFPLGFSIVLSILLTVRVVHRNRAGAQTNAQRRKHLKMVCQLLLISSLHVACVLPYALVIFIQVVTKSLDFGVYIQNIYFYYLFYLLNLLQPFVCIGCLPEVVTKIKKWGKKQSGGDINMVPLNRNRT